MQRNSIFDKTLIDIQAISADIRKFIKTPLEQPEKIYSLEKNINAQLDQIDMFLKGNTTGMPIKLFAEFAFDCIRYYHFQLNKFYQSIKNNYKNYNPESKGNQPLPDAKLTMHSSQAFRFNPNLLGERGDGLQQHVQNALRLTQSLFSTIDKTNFSEKQLNDIENVCNKLIELITNISEPAPEDPPLNTPHDTLPHCMKTPGNLRLVAIEKRWKQMKLEIPKLVTQFNQVKEELADPFTTAEERAELETKKRELKKQMQALKSEDERLNAEHLQIRTTRPPVVDAKNATPPLTNEEKEAEAKEQADHIASCMPQLHPSNLSRKALERLALDYHRERNLARLLWKENKLDMQNPYQVPTDILFKTTVRALIDLDPTPDAKHAKMLNKILTRLDEIDNELSKKEKKLAAIQKKSKLENSINNLKNEIQQLENEYSLISTEKFVEQKNAILAALTTENLEKIAEAVFDMHFTADDQEDPHPVETPDNPFDSAVKQWWKENAKLNILWSDEMLPYVWFKEALLRLELATEENNHLILVPVKKKRSSKSLARKSKKPSQKPMVDSDSDSESDDEPVKLRQINFAPSTVSLKPKNNGKSKKRVRKQEKALPESAHKRVKTKPSVEPVPAVEEKKELGPFQFEFSNYKANKFAVTETKDTKKPRKKANEYHDNISVQEDYQTFIKNILKSDKTQDVLRKLDEKRNEIYVNKIYVEVPSANSIDLKELTNTPFINAIGWGLTALGAAAINPACPQKIIDALLEKGADINYIISSSTPYSGCSILMLACLCNNEMMINTLLQRNVNLRFANPKKGNFHNWTAFEFAVLGGHIDLVRRLLNFHVLMDTKEGSHLWEAALEKAPDHSKEPMRALINRYYEERDLFLATQAQEKAQAAFGTASMDTQEDAMRFVEQFFQRGNQSAGAGSGAGADSPIDKDSKDGKKSRLKPRQHFSRSPSRILHAPKTGLMYGSPKRSISSDFKQGAGPSGLSLDATDDTDLEMGIAQSLAQNPIGLPGNPSHSNTSFEKKDTGAGAGSGAGSGAGAGQTQYYPSYPSAQYASVPYGVCYANQQSLYSNAGHSYYSPMATLPTPEAAIPLSGPSLATGAGAEAGQTMYYTSYPSVPYASVPYGVCYGYQQSLYSNAGHSYYSLMATLPTPEAAIPLGGGSSLAIGQRLTQEATRPTRPAPVNVATPLNSFGGQLVGISNNQVQQPLPVGFAGPGAPPLAYYNPTLFAPGGVPLPTTPSNGVLKKNNNLQNGFNPNSR